MGTGYEGSQSDAECYFAARRVLRDRVGYVINEQKFHNWRQTWDSKQAVIDQLIDDLERSMRASECLSANSLKVISEDDELEPDGSEF